MGRGTVGFGAAAAARGAVFGALVAVGVIASACGDAARLEGCEGVRVDGDCQQKCDETACLEADMKCVQNACSQPCNTHSDCPPGKYCYSTLTDDGIDGLYCAYAPFAKHDGGIGQYEPCAGDDECDVERGYFCASGECRLKCVQNLDCANLPGTCVKAAAKSYCQPGPARTGPYQPCTTTAECDEDLGLGCVDGECRFLHCKTHGDCASIGLCTEGSDAEGKQVLACSKTTTYPLGQFGTLCPGGPEAKECDEANHFVCQGSGAGDLTAYCTKLGCSADTDCATGYVCAAERTSALPCSSTCDLKGADVAGCVAPEEIGPGKPYSCGSTSLVKHICVARDYCHSCKNDDDCRARAGQVCAQDGSGTKICTVLCDPTAGSPCPWEGASKCGVFDAALGKPTCAHRFGSCSGSGKSCEPCRDESDCPGGLCVTAYLGGERYCVDLSVSCSCAGQALVNNAWCSGGGCPQTPGGAEAKCYGGDGAASSKTFEKCVGGNLTPATPTSFTGGCWPPG